MKKKSVMSNFVLGYNPEISLRLLKSPYDEFKNVIGSFDKLEVVVGRLSKEAFQVKVIITGAYNSPHHLENTVSGLIGDVLQLSNGVKIRLVQFSCPVVGFSASEGDTYLTIEFFI